MCSTRLNPSGKNTHDNTKSVNAQYVQNTRTKYAEYINMIFRGSIAGKKDTFICNFGSGRKETKHWITPVECDGKNTLEESTLNQSVFLCMLQV